jgi:hypothetical protein
MFLFLGEKRIESISIACLESPLSLSLSLSLSLPNFSRWVEIVYMLGGETNTMNVVGLAR